MGAELSTELRVITLILVTVLLSCYLLIVVQNSNALITEVWVFAKILWATIATFTALVVFGYLGLLNNAHLFVLVIQAFLVVILLPLKYPNSLSIAGYFDSLAHYAYTKWAVVHGYLEASGLMTYSTTYRYHPGNAVIPGMLSIVSYIEVGWSMNLVLIANYLCYLLFLIATLGRLYVNKKHSHVEDLLLLGIISITVYLSPVYGGREIGYAYIAGLLYTIIVHVIKVKNITSKSITLMLILFLGVLFTHVSTAALFLVFLAFVVLLTFILWIINKNNIILSAWFGSMCKLVTILVVAFLIYEIFVDVLLFGSTLQNALKNIYMLYVQELEVLRYTMETKGVSLMDAIIYLVGGYAKVLSILVLSFLQVVLLVTKRKFLDNYQKLVAFSVFGIYVTLFTYWAGVAAIIRQPRAISLLSFVLTINSGTLYKLYEKKLRAIISRWKIMGFAFILCMVLIGFTSNFGLPLVPVITTDNEDYIRVLPSQLGFGNYPLHPITFLDLHQASIPILRLRPFTTFGFTDLLWNTLKLPPSSDIVPPVASPEAIIKAIQEFIGKNVIVPCILKEGALPGTVGYNSLYYEPYIFLLNNGKSVLYNNGAYILFLV